MADTERIEFKLGQIHEAIADVGKALGYASTSIDSIAYSLDTIATALDIGLKDICDAIKAR